MRLIHPRHRNSIFRIPAYRISSEFEGILRVEVKQSPRCIVICSLKKKTNAYHLNITLNSNRIVLPGRMHSILFETPINCSVI